MTPVGVDLDVGGYLVDLPVVHHGDAIGHRQRLELVVDHVQGRDTGIASHALEFHADVLAEPSLGHRDGS